MDDGRSGISGVDAIALPPFGLMSSYTSKELNISIPKCLVYIFLFCRLGKKFSTPPFYVLTSNI